MKKKFKEQLLSKSSCDDYKTAIQEWVCTEVEYAPSSRCICGHKISYIYWFRNVYNNNEIPVGCCCQEKFEFKGADEKSFREQYWNMEDLKEKVKTMNTWNKFFRDALEVTDVDYDYSSLICDWAKSRRISDWEEKFLTSIFVSHRAGRLSTKQTKCLARTRDNLLKHIPQLPCTLCYRSPT